MIFSPQRVTVIVSCVLLGALGTLVPFDTVAVPEWKVRVVNQNGVVQPGKQVRQLWKNYSLEGSDDSEHYEVRVTDQNGEVVFAERRDTASLLHRLLATSLNMVQTVLSHSSIGIQSYVYCADASSPFIFCNGCAEPPDVLVIADEDLNGKSITSLLRGS